MSRTVQPIGQTTGASNASHVLGVGHGREIPSSYLEAKVDMIYKRNSAGCRKKALLRITKHPESYVGLNMSINLPTVFHRKSFDYVAN